MLAKHHDGRINGPGLGLTGCCAVLALLVCAQPAAAEQWAGKDKTLHLAVSAALGSSAYGTLWLFRERSGDPAWVRLLIASSAALLPGVAKEIYDAGRTGNRFSVADLTWDLAGVSIGAGVIYLVERLVGRPSDRLARIIVGPFGAGVGVTKPF